LTGARLVGERKDGKTVIYLIADDHVLKLIENAIEQH